MRDAGLDGVAERLLRRWLGDEFTNLPNEDDAVRVVAFVLDRLSDRVQARVPVIPSFRTPIPSPAVLTINGEPCDPLAPETAVALLDVFLHAIEDPCPTFVALSRGCGYQPKESQQDIERRLFYALTALVVRRGQVVPSLSERFVENLQEALRAQFGNEAVSEVWRYVAKLQGKTVCELATCLIEESFTKVGEPKKPGFTMRDRTAFTFKQLTLGVGARVPFLKALPELPALDVGMGPSVNLRRLPTSTAASWQLSVSAM